MWRSDPHAALVAGSLSQGGPAYELVYIPISTSSWQTVKLTTHSTQPRTQVLPSFHWLLQGSPPFSETGLHNP